MPRGPFVTSTSGIWPVLSWETSYHGRGFCTPGSFCPGSRLEETTICFWRHLGYFLFYSFTSYSYLIFVNFLTPALISSSKFDTKKCVNRDTADFATKQLKLNYSFAKAKIQLKLKRCGVLWSGVERCGVVWSGVKSCEVVWSGVEWCVVEWCEVV